MPHLLLLIISRPIMQHLEYSLITTALRLANDRLSQQDKENEKRAAELIVANKELAYQNMQKELRAAELIFANNALAFQNNEKQNRATELIAINNDLKKAEKYQKQYIKGLEKMIYHISHRVRQPICQIVGIASLLEIPNSVEEVKKMVGYVKASASSLDIFTQDLTKMIKRLKDKSQLKQIDLASSCCMLKG